MIKNLMKLGCIPILSLILFGCSGGDSSSAPVPPIVAEDPNFELTIKLNGLNNNEAISFDWIGKNYSINSDSQFTVQAAEFTDPQNIAFPNNYQCNSIVNKLSTSNYELIIDCEENIISDLLTISIVNPLPYEVQLEVKNQSYLIQNESLTIDNMQLETPKITSTAGPLICELNNNTPSFWQLTCEEYSITSELSQTGSTLKFYLITATKKIDLEINDDKDIQDIKIHHQSNKQWFSTGENTYLVKLNNGNYEKVEKQDAAIISIEKYNNSLFGLAADGLYELSNNSLNWIKVRPITRTLASKLNLSGNTLSWLTQSDNSLVLDRFVNSANKSSITANKEAIGAAEHAAIKIDNGTLWLAKNNVEEWILVAVDVAGNRVDQIIQSLNSNVNFAIWGADNQDDKLLMIEGDSILNFVIANQNLNWQIHKNTAGNIIAASKQLLVTANTLADSQAELAEIYSGNNVLTSAQFAQALNLTSAPLITLSTNAHSFSQINLKEGFLLFYTENEQEVWVTDGTIENSKKALTNISWEQFSQLRIASVGESIVLIKNNEETNSVITSIDR